MKRQHGIFTIINQPTSPQFGGEEKVMRLTKEIIWTAIITVIWCWLLHQLAIQLSK